MIRVLIILIFVSCQDECSFKRGYSLEKNGDIENAIECYKSLLGTKEEADACNRLIEIYTMKNRIDSVIKYREVVFHNQTNDKSNIFELGNLNYKRGNITNALNYFMMIQRRDSLYPELNYNLAVIHLSLGANTAALKNIRSEIREYGNSSKNSALLGQIYLQLDQYSESLSAYTKAIEGDSSNDNYYFLRGVVYYYADSLDKAIADLEKCIIINKDHVNALKLKIEIGMEINTSSLCDDILILERLQILSEEMKEFKEKCNN